MKSFFLVLDAGTTGVKALVFDEDENVMAQAGRLMEKSFPGPGLVEQDPNMILHLSLEVLREAAGKVDSDLIKSFGIANQRETVLAWRASTGEALYPAIVWQDERTRRECEEISVQHGPLVLAKTGLPVVPYFSATKIAWLLKNVPVVREALAEKDLQVGTLDSWLLFNLAEGGPFLTDPTNASRTLLFDVRKGCWDEELCRIFGVPPAVLPRVKPSPNEFGALKRDVAGQSVPVRVLVGDQQASTFAAGPKVGTTKITYGTGIFLSQIIPEFGLPTEPFMIMLTANRNEPYFALEAKVSSCADRSDPLFKAGKNEKLGDLFDEFSLAVAGFVKKLPIVPPEIIIDGGVSQNDVLLKKQRAVLNVPITRQRIANGTALGVCRLLRS